MIPKTSSGDGLESRLSALPAVKTDARDLPHDLHIGLGTSHAEEDQLASHEVWCEHVKQQALLPPHNHLASDTRHTIKPVVIVLGTLSASLGVQNDFLAKCGLSTGVCSFPPQD